MSMTPAEPWLTLAELAAVIRKTERWITDQCAAEGSTFPHHRVGRELRFSPDDQARIDAMFAGGRGPDEVEEPITDDALERALQGVAKRRRRTVAASAAR